MSEDRKQAHSGLSVTTLMIASASSVVAAMVVSNLWGPGTVISAAATPVIVALVSEALKRPARVIDTVRVSRAARFDPLAEGRRGLREGDLDEARPAMPAAAQAERRAYEASSIGEKIRRLPRPRVMAAIATGIAAFVLAGVLLTSSELLLGKSVVSSSKRTTYIPVKRDTAGTKTTTDKTDTTTAPSSDTTTTPTPETTTASPEPRATETTPTAPPGETAPAAPPPTTTAPPSAAPQTTTTAPAPAPAPSATPPASTTP